MSTTSSSSSVNSFYTSGGTTRLNGSELMSGLDTQKLIEALTSKTQSKITKQKQSEQKVKWKQEMYRDVESLMKTFSDTYFSYASSSTNIQSSTFFDSEDLVSSSSLVSATGAASDAGNIVINSISQLAKAASLNCGNLVSEENITSGTLRDSWTESTVGGKSMVITYAGIDYTVTLSSSVNLDSGATSQQNLQTLADGLNDQIRDTSGLKGNIEFTVASDNKLTLKSTDGKSTVKISDYEATKDDTSGKDFLEALGFQPGDSGTSLTSSESINAGGSVDNVTSSKLFNQSISSPAYLNVKVGNSTYSFSLSGLDLSSATDSNSAAQKVVDQINKLASETTGLKDTHFTATTTNGKISFSADQTVSVTGGSSHLLDGLGLTVGSNAATDAVDKTTLTKSYFGDTLAGSTVTFNLNGIKKTISFDASEESQYSDYTDADGIQSYLQQKLDAAYGSGKITVGMDGGKLTFTTPSDSTSVLEISSSSSSSVLGKDGALRIETGETNRTETSKTLKDLSSELSIPLHADTVTIDGQQVSGYEFEVNGKTFTFSEDTELNTVLNTINNDTDASVNISYSQTLNEFRITADDTGAQGKISVSDNKGNLTRSLFGIDYSDISEIQTNEIAKNSDGKYTTGTENSTYTFKIGNGDSQTITIDVTIDANQNFDSLSDMAIAVQNTINQNSTLNGKIIVGYTNDGKLTFNTFDNTSADSQLTVQQTDGGDGLEIGNSLRSTTVIQPDSTLADLAGTSNGLIVQNGDGYSITGDSTNTVYSGDTKLNEIGYNGLNEGTDLTMSVSLNGGGSQTITRTANTTTLDGITLTVTGTTKEGDSPVKFTASNDVDDLYKKISDFVDAYNKIIDKANTYTSQTPYGLHSESGKSDSYEPLTDDEKKDMTDDEIDKWNEKAKQGLLENDNTLNSILSDMRSAVEETVSSTGMSLQEIGISVSPDYTDGGKLTVSESTLKSALKSNPDKVSQLFTNTDGISSKIKKVLEKNIGIYGTSGTLYSIAGSDSTTGADNSQLSNQISQYEKTITSLKSQLQTEKDRWLSKFTEMETKLNVLNSQYTYLSSMTES
ncbi:MAG: flagellar filament capping protein FliD [Oscillospiraceae bacterium]|nr:flagellar filament capping protein FliD [Oscillospiraceae bacterium]